MALQRRMIYAQLAENKNFAMMSDKAQKTYIFLVVLADDDGRVKGDTDWLRIKIFPYDNKVTAIHMKDWIKEITGAGLITWYKSGSEYFIQHPNWTKYQILRADRIKASNIPPPNDNQVSTKRVHKISKLSKKREDNIIYHSSYLKNIPEQDIKEFVDRFDASRKAITSKAEDLFIWCEENGKIKKNYRMFLLKILKNDFKERKPEKPKIQQEKEIILTEEQKELRSQTLKSVGDMLRAKGIVNGKK